MTLRESNVAEVITIGPAGTIAEGEHEEVFNYRLYSIATDATYEDRYSEHYESEKVAQYRRHCITSNDPKDRREPFDVQVYVSDHDQRGT